MRPSSKAAQCFYCHQPIGAEHGPACVLVKKRVVVRMVVEYEVAVPSDWDKRMIEFARNESGWCADNALDELKSIIAPGKCLCGRARFEHVRDVDAPATLEES